MVEIVVIVVVVIVVVVIVVIVVVVVVIVFPLKSSGKIDVTYTAIAKKYRVPLHIANMK